MSNWKDKARALAMEQTLTLDQIGRIVGKSPQAVHEACKGIPRRPRPPRAWVLEARRMFVEDGATVAELRQRFGKSRSAIQRVVEGLPRAEHQQRNRPGPRDRPRNAIEPEWWAEARALRARHVTCEEIADRFGKSLHSVKKITANVLSAQAVRAAQVRGLVASWETRRAQAKDHPRPPRQRNKPPPLSDAEIRFRERKRRVRSLVSHDRVVRETPPVTLPRLTFLD